MTPIVVGGGPTGVELAGALAELRRQVLPHDYPDMDLSWARILLLEATDRILPGMQGAMSMQMGVIVHKITVRMKVAG